MFPKRILYFCFFITVIGGRTVAQIYSPAASDSFDTHYVSMVDTDKVFVFNRPDYQAGVTASIIAVSVDRLTGWTFQWSVFDHATGTYQTIPGSGNGWFSAIDTITVPSGYRVVMTKGAASEVFRVWILINDLDLHITNKDADDKLLFGYFNCSSLDLRADTTLVPSYYFDPVTNDRIDVHISYIIRWTTDNPEASRPPSKLITRVNNPPSQDTWYILTLTDPYGLERTDSVFYKSIQSEAKLATPEYVDLSDEIEYAGKNYGLYYNDDIYSAPGRYRFDLSGSKNMVSYEINFGDGEVFVSDNTTLTVVHEYKKPGLYKIVLTTKSDVPYECLDSDSSAKAELVYSQFTLPNVFTPNSDGENDVLSMKNSNDVFRSEDVSVVSIEIAIFDRAGIKVHEYAGAILDWPGWNGKVRNSNRDAPEGVYFYVISALYRYKPGAVSPDSETHKGFFHLYRE